MLFILHPTILKYTMSMEVCTTVDGTAYLDIYMNDECWTGDHWNYAIAVAVPSFIVWGIGFPAIAFTMLYRLNKKRKLFKPVNKKVYGFLFSGYELKYYWWELVILARKVMILSTLIWLSQISTVVQALVALFFLITAIYL